MNVVATPQQDSLSTALKRDAQVILSDVVKGLLSIPFGPIAETSQGDAPTWLHWCADCQHYHRYR